MFGRNSKPRLASRKFWLDGGYDLDCVEACRYHPLHAWWEFRLGDVLVPGACSDPDEHMVICRCCYVPRCGSSGDEDPCMLPRHHGGDHVTRSNLTPAEPNGVT